MSATSADQSSLQQLTAARLRDAQPDELLDLADAAIEQAAAGGDRLTLELIAAELDSAATARPETGDGLRVAAARARAALRPAPPPPLSRPLLAAPEEVEQRAGEVAAYASWGSRFLACLIDWCLLLVAALVVGDLLGDSAGVVSWTLGAFAYFVFFNGQGRTLGKRLLRIKVVDASAAAPIGAGRAALRELIRLALTVFTLGIGLLLDSLRPLWNENHQSWHDAAAGSIVVRDR
jgi:uncharacterized RDD family membrane protein YckC